MPVLSSLRSADLRLENDTVSRTLTASAVSRRQRRAVPVEKVDPGARNANVFLENVPVSIRHRFPSRGRETECDDVRSSSSTTRRASASWRFLPSREAPARDGIRQHPPSDNTDSRGQIYGCHRTISSAASVVQRMAEALIPFS